MLDSVVACGLIFGEADAHENDAATLRQVIDSQPADVRLMLLEAAVQLRGATHPRNAPGAAWRTRRWTESPRFEPAFMRHGISALDLWACVPTGPHARGGGPTAPVARFAASDGSVVRSPGSVGARCTRGRVARSTDSTPGGPFRGNYRKPARRRG